MRYSPSAQRTRESSADEDDRARTTVCSPVKKIILFYGVLGGLLIAGLKFIEYRFLVLEHSLEIYGGLVALLFSLLGIWLGLKLTRTRVIVREVQVEVPVTVHVPVRMQEPFVADPERVRRFGITPREMEILEAIAAGLSILFTVVIIVVFFLDTKVNTAPPVTVIYPESWSANRTDAEIKADQVKDQKAREERAAVLQEQFKEIANSFGIE